MSAYVHQAELRLGEDTDPAAVGAAVTVALCGHWEHDPPCRWPHNNALEGNALESSGTFRTLFIAPEHEEQHVRERITAALAAGQSWQIVRVGPRDVAPSERDLAERLSALP